MSSARSTDSARERDAILVGRCLDGDEEAWTELVRRHSPLVWAVARQIGLGHADAADVHQTVWRIAVQDLSRVRKAESFARWLARTAHYQSLRVVRGYGIARRAVERVPPSEETAPGPDELLSRLEQRQLVAAALERIGDRCRDLLRLLYFASPRLSYAEIGKQLDMPVGSIGPTRARCLGRLETQLGDQFHDAND